MRTLLTAVNAKYIHSNLAVYSLCAFVQEKREVYRQSVRVAEYTINQQIDEILMDLYKRKPDIICFSCYLWNIEFVRQLVQELPKILPGVIIWLGGPEVSYNAAAVLETLDGIQGIMCGEGEETFFELLEYYHGRIVSLQKIAGIVYREADRIRSNPLRPALDMNLLPFIYASEAALDSFSGGTDGGRGMEKFRNRIIYYESSRGCPFSCSYCLSSIDKCLRFRDIEKVKRELQFFIDQKVPQVKFVDRTFNCRHEHAYAIWSYLAEHDNGKTNFHFEAAADLLNEEELSLLASLRPGLIQLEIGVQSTNERTIREIRRRMDFERVKRAVKQIRASHNVHQHLDLIAGLPYENYESFRKSFNEVYALRPEQLQLGFLKVLKGSRMERQAGTYQLVYQDRPPFEVLSTRWLSYADIIRLKGIEAVTEVYYNSGQFVHTLELLEKEFEDAFSLYEALSAYYEEHGLNEISHSRIARYEILFAFIQEYNERSGSSRGADGKTEDIPDLRYGWMEEVREALTYDLYLRENVKNRPAFAGEPTVTKEEARTFYGEEAVRHCFLRGYEQYDKRQIQKMTHLERVKGRIALFDYKNRDALTKQATVRFL